MLVLKYKNNIISNLNEGQIGNGSSNIWFKPNGEKVDIDTVVTVIDGVIQDMAIHYPSVERIIKHKDIIYTDDPRIDTMATDGVSIFINPAFAEELINEYDVVALEFVLIHEVLHILFDHCYKLRQNLDKYSDTFKVNLAQDYEVNFIIENFMRESSGLAPFKGISDKIGGCYNESWGKKGYTWEEIYSLLPKINRIIDLQKTSDEWKKGFLDGYNETMNDLKKQNLVESYEI